MRLSILYRGPLASCNYGCGYCPFAKHRSPAEELAADRRGLDRFVDWARRATDFELHILFTPWGEALIREWYRTAMIALSRMPNVRKVACQTNLSFAVDWLAETNRERSALWTTYHPSETPYERFLERCRRLITMGVAFSVGVVGLRSHFDAIERLRADLPPHVYVWVNAYKSEGLDYYRAAERDFLAAVDPLFPLNAVRHRSLGQACRTGLDAISVDGEGNIRRCHFVAEPLGNLYRDDLGRLLRPRPCPRTECGCHIGYVHLDSLGQRPVYGDGLMARIPRTVPPPSTVVIPGHPGPQAPEAGRG